MSGLWHGANWTFIVWGLLHAIYYLLTILIIGHKAPKGTVADSRILPSIKEFSSMLLTFVLVSFSYIFFRAESLNHAFSYIIGIFYASNLVTAISIKEIIVLLLIIQLLIVDWRGRYNKHSFEKMSNNKILNFFIYLFIIVEIIVFKGNSETFIYFQF